jgi:toxin ParE1/3/4
MGEEKVHPDQTRAGSSGVGFAGARLKARWTMPAANQLEGIFDYISDDNPAAAERIVRRIHDSISRAARMPKAGRTGRAAGTREIAVSGTPYLVAYLILEDSMHVLAILHGAQRWPKSF